MVGGERESNSDAVSSGQGSGAVADILRRNRCLGREEVAWEMLTLDLEGNIYHLEFITAIKDNLSLLRLSFFVVILYCIGSYSVRYSHISL